jgi:hypothetical protein
MSSAPGTPTLDQLRVFLTVVDVGSFAGAARKLGRATSVISYSIANLEAQLGVLLFDRESTRKPQLTEAGRTVLSDAHHHQWDQRAPRQGERPSSGPRSRNQPRLRRDAAGLARGRRAEGVSSGVSDGIAAPLCRSAWGGDANGAQPHGHDRDRRTARSGGRRDRAHRVGSVELIPVASPDHPLGLAGRNAPGATISSLC